MLSVYLKIKKYGCKKRNANTFFVFNLSAKLCLICLMPMAKGNVVIQMCRLNNVYDTELTIS